MKLKDLRIGNAVTCLQGVPVYSYERSFRPGLVGFVAALDRHLPAEVIVDFYYKLWPDCNSREQTLYRCCLRLNNVQKVADEQAKVYLWENAPTWEEHVTSLIRWYNDDHFQAIQCGKGEPYPQYPSHEALVPFLLTYPTQQQFLGFLSAYKKTYEYTGRIVEEKVETLLLTSGLVSPVRIPWTYRVAGVSLS